jgi:cysteine-rich repeat protein
MGGTPPGCSDSTIAGEEQCDDGNVVNLDGCDLQCRYELYLRVNSMEIKSGPAPAWCDQQTNGLGSALTDLALGQVNPSLQDGINTGGTNIILQPLGLDDLTGSDDSAFDLGVTSGEPDPAAGTWPANDPLDWAFLLDPASLDANGVPTARLQPSTLTAHALASGPSSINLSLTISGSLANLEILNASLRGRVTGATSTPAPPPPQLAPGISVLEMVEANGADEGLCGNVTVDSLSKIAIPEALTTGIGACGDCAGSHAYTYCGADQPVGPNCNSLLDALVGGCKALVCVQEVVVPTQPDVKNGGATLAVAGPTNKVPDADTNGNKDAYSAFFTFTAKRQKASGKQP